MIEFAYALFAVGFFSGMYRKDRSGIAVLVLFSIFWPFFAGAKLAVFTVEEDTE